MFISLEMSSNKRRKLTEQANALLDTPPDLLYVIVSKLDPEDIAAMCRVNQKFNELCKHNNFWGRILTAAGILYESNATNEQNRRMFIAYKAYESRNIRLQRRRSVYNNDRIYITINGNTSDLHVNPSRIQPMGIMRTLISLFGSNYKRDYAGYYIIPSSTVIQLIYTLLDEHEFKVVTETRFLSCAICGEIPKHTCSTCDKQFCSVECSIKSKC